MLIDIRSIQRFSDKGISVFIGRRSKYDRERISETCIQCIIQFSLSGKCRSSCTRTITLSQDIDSSQFRLVGKADGLCHQCKSSSARPCHRSFSCKFSSQHRHTAGYFIFSLIKYDIMILSDYFDQRRRRCHRVRSIKIHS